MFIPTASITDVSTNRAWYVVKTKPRQEVQTSVVLSQRGVEVLLPKLAVWTGGLKGAKSTKLEPLFPGYLFTRLDLHSPEWIAARSAPGVAYFLGSAGMPTAVPDDLVEKIRVRAEAQRRHGWLRFKAGDRVVITGGPLSGFEAVFEGHLSPAGRSRVLIEIVSRLVPVVVSDKLLRRAG